MMVLVFFFIVGYLECVKLIIFRYAAELFPQIAPILADLNTHLENIAWVKSLSFSDGKMVSL